jgi:hypothetical protein
MLEEMLLGGIQAALARTAHQSEAEMVTRSIVASAVTDAQSGSRNIVELRPGSDRAIWYDIPKAVFGAAGVLGAAIPLLSLTTPIGSAGIAAGLGALGGLGALLGIRVELGWECAEVLLILLSNRELTIEQLRERYVDCHRLPAPEAAAEQCESALQSLAKLGVVRRSKTHVKLLDRVVVRF